MADDHARCVKVTEDNWRTATAPPSTGFTDIDGSRPDVWRYTEAAESGDRDIDPNDYR